MAALTDSVPPFLRWAGGKRWLIPRVLGLLEGHRFHSYHEPFLGGASIALSVPGLPSNVYLSDLNDDLIETYEQVRDHPRSVIKHLLEHENSAEHYYATRSLIPASPAARAARFIFLNHTSYNGIYRVNLRGQYNVPFGSRVHLRIPDSSHLMAASLRLRNASMTAQDFFDSISAVESGSLVFLDPPYTVAHNENGFIKYNQKLFSFEDQERLSQYIDVVKERGAHYILTNAAHHSIAKLFDKGDARIDVERRNSIGGAKAVRGRVAEYLFTNLARQ